MKRALANISLTAREELKKDNIAVSVVYPYMTLTDFEKNTIKDAVPEAGEQDGDPPFPADTAEYVAQKILEGIESGEAEIFAHGWMKRRDNTNPLLCCIDLFGVLSGILWRSYSRGFKTESVPSKSMLAEWPRPLVNWLVVQMCT